MEWDIEKSIIFEGMTGSQDESRIKELVEETNRREKVFMEVVGKKDECGERLLRAENRIKELEKAIEKHKSESERRNCILDDDRELYQEIGERLVSHISTLKEKINELETDDKSRLKAGDNMGNR